jgi:hypothetical protein
MTMMSRKVLGASGAVIAVLLAGGFAITSVQSAQSKTVEVLVRPRPSAVRAPLPPSARLTIPLRYFARGTSPSDEAAKAGVEKLVLDIEPADLPQALGGKAPDLAGAPLRIELAALARFTEDLGERRRSEALNQPEGSPKQMWVNPPDYPQDVSFYYFPNLDPTAAAYYFKVKEDGVFVDCSERPRCRGFQSWRGLLDVQYEYARAGLDDPRPMNAAVNRLLESFKPTAAPVLKQSDQSRTEPPIFQPSTPASNTGDGSR